MQQRFKKVRTSWMEELVASLSSNPILACDFAPILKSYKITSLAFQVKSSIRTLSPPQLSIDIDHQIVQKLNEKAIRTRKTYQACLLTDSLDNQITNIEELPPESFDGEDQVHNENGFFKIGLAIVREQGIKKTKQRIERQLRHCSERSGARFTYLKQKKDSCDLFHLLLSLVVRMFLVVQQKQRKLKIARLLYYPKVDIQIQKIRIIPFSFIMNQTLKKITGGDFQKQTLYGYISLSQNEKKQYKFLLLSAQQLQQISNNNFPVIGIFFVGKLGGQLKQESLLWSLIMQYLSNPLLNNRRLCLNGPRTGFLFHFQQNNKHYYQFEVPLSAKWKLSTSVQTFTTFPKEIIFATRQIIMEEEREQSEVQSVQSKQVYPLPDGPSDAYSSRSFDEKDLEITRLKAELQKYKNQNEWLKQLVANLTNNQSTFRPTHPAKNYPKSNVSISNIVHQALPSQEYCGNFGYEMKLQRQKETVRLQTVQKQFKIRDSKNISFAQQNSFEDQNQIGTFIQDQQFLSPQFTLKETSSSKQQVKAFQMLQHQQIQQPYLQKEKKLSAREPLQSFSQNKTQQKKTYLDPKNQLKSTAQIKNKCTPSVQKQENIQIFKNQPTLEKESVSPKKTQTNEASSQRNKAFGSITPRQHLDIPKKYLEQEINLQSEKKQIPKKSKQVRKKQQQNMVRSSKKIIALNSQSDDEEVNKIIAERNRRK